MTKFDMTYLLHKKQCMTNYIFIKNGFAKHNNYLAKPFLFILKILFFV